MIKLLILLIFLGGCTQQGEKSNFDWALLQIREQQDALAHLESELFATKKLLFLCESEMQELYNVPGLGREIDSILGNDQEEPEQYFQMSQSDKDMLIEHFEKLDSGR